MLPLNSEIISNRPMYMFLIINNITSKMCCSFFCKLTNSFNMLFLSDLKEFFYA